MQLSSEADARINIDQLLREAGWDPADKRQVRAEFAISAETVGEVSDSTCSILTDTERSAPKRADYVLHASDGKPLAVIEAKKNAIDPYRAKNQALPYAKSMNAPFIFLSNGEAIYLLRAELM
jgi:type I restriction enzyme R subunit